MGRVWLRYTDEQVMQLTPRQLFAQLRVHAELQERKYGSNKNNVDATINGFIDTMPGWD